MHVPICFNAALDIILTDRFKNKIKYQAWTQGSLFSFKEGDTLYDTPDAYKPWNEALKNIKVCIKINKAADVIIFENEKRFPGSVTFTVYIPNENRTKIIERSQHTLTQDQFVEFLITGEYQQNKGVKMNLMELRKKIQEDFDSYKNGTFKPDTENINSSLTYIYWPEDEPFLFHEDIVLPDEVINVQSSKKPDRSYKVKLDILSCTCQGFRNRRALFNLRDIRRLCKHRVLKNIAQVFIIDSLRLC